MIKTISILYKTTTTGKIQRWEIQVDGDKYRTVVGKDGGKLITNEWTKCEPKNIGKANETTAEEQALKEVEAQIKKKIESGYVSNIKKVGKAKFFEPMLAHNWKDYKDEVNYPLFVQPKLDGIRCIITKDGMFSRNGKPIISAPHIFELIKLYVFKDYPNIVLDGELYNHDLKFNFNKIVSLVKKTKPTDEDLDESAKLIQFWCYDLVDTNNKDLPFSERTKLVQKLNVVDNIYVTVSTQVVSNQKELEWYYDKMLEADYEGMIIRNANSKYENKRTKNLLKRKEFIDEEYKILDVIEGIGNRTGTAGYMLFETVTGKKFKSNIKGDFDYLKDLLKNRRKLIGKLATIKYFKLTPDGVPRFPFVISIRDYE